MATQAPRHWRMKQNNYRLQGVQHINGKTSIVERPAPVVQTEDAQEAIRADDTLAENAA